MSVTKPKDYLPEKHRIVAESIREGIENATLLSDIMVVAGISERRHAHIIIEDLINHYGYVILANRKGQHRGYFVPKDDKEFQAVVSSFKSNISSMNRRYSNLLLNHYGPEEHQEKQA